VDLRYKCINMITNKKQSDYEGATEEELRAKRVEAIQKAQAEYIQFWKSCKVDDDGFIDQGPYVEMEAKFGLKKIFAGMQDDVIKMQYENGDDVDNEWALETMEPDTYVLLLPVYWKATAEFEEADGEIEELKVVEKTKKEALHAIAKAIYTLVWHEPPMFDAEAFLEKYDANYVNDGYGSRAGVRRAVADAVASIEVEKQ